MSHVRVRPVWETTTTAVKLHDDDKRKWITFRIGCDSDNDKSPKSYYSFVTANMGADNSDKMLFMISRASWATEVQPRASYAVIAEPGLVPIC